MRKNTMLTRFQFDMLTIGRTILVAILFILPMLLYFSNIVTNTIAMYILSSVIFIIVISIKFPLSYEEYLEQQKKIAAIKDKHKADTNSQAED